MKPVDLRNATWQAALEHVTEDMLRVHEAWLTHGPGTTRAVAERSGISLLTLRPRTTDLYKLGLVELVDAKLGIRSSEGVYRFVRPADAETSQSWRSRADFRGAGRVARQSPSLPSFYHSVTTVEAAIATLTPTQQVRIAAAIMARHGHNKRRTSDNPAQLDLIGA